MASMVTLTGGAFQDSQGNVLANGYLKMKLSQDGSVSGSGQIASGIELTINLDASGNVTGSPSVWGNDVIATSQGVNTTFYRVTGYTSKGQLAWGPNNQQVTGAGPFNVGTWQPNTVLSWALNQALQQAISLQTNGVVNANQTVENLQAGTGISLANDSTGKTTITNTAGGPILPAAAGGLRFVEVVADTTGGGTATITITGYQAGAQSQGTLSVVTATATEPFGTHFLSSASASTNEILGVTIGGGAAAQLQVSPGVLNRWSNRIRFNSTTNVRWWTGLANQVSILSTATFATDTPAAIYAAFRFSSGTDTTIKAVCGTDASHQTVVDTTIAIDTVNSQLFEITWDGTNFNFFINSTQRAQISTNIPSAGTNIQTWWGGDNKNTANAFNADFFWMAYSLAK